MQWAAIVVIETAYTHTHICTHMCTQFNNWKTHKPKIIVENNGEEKTASRQIHALAVVVPVRYLWNQIGRKTEEKRQIVHLSNRIDNGKGKTNKCLHTYGFSLHFDSITIIFGFLFEFTLPDQKISNKNAKMPTFFQSVRFAAAAHGFE